MSSLYPSKREKIQNIANLILSYVNSQDLDYLPILDYLMYEFNSPRYVVKEIIDMVIQNKGFTVLPDGTITLSENQVEIWLKEEKIKKEKQTKKVKDADEEMDNLVKIAKKFLADEKNTENNRITTESFINKQGGHPHPIL